MGEASGELHAIKPKAALPHEQDALELLTKAMMELDKVLTRMRSGGSQAAADNIEMDMEDLQDTIEQDETSWMSKCVNKRKNCWIKQEICFPNRNNSRSKASRWHGRGSLHSERCSKIANKSSRWQDKPRQMAEQAQQMGQSSGQGAGQSNTGQRMVQAGEALQQASENMQAASENMGAGQPQMGAAKGEKAEENLQQAIEEP